MSRRFLEETATITLGTTHLQYTLRRTARKSVGLQISDKGLVVSAPHHLPHAELSTALKERQIWILSRLSHWRECQARMLSLEELIRKDLRLPVAGKHYLLQFDPTLKRTRHDEANLQIHLPMQAPESAKEFDKALLLIQKLMKTLAKARFQNVANQVAARRNLPPFSLHLTSARCRWGSCNSEGELRLNWRLMYYPDKVIEYVVAHEMAHLIQMNHSPAFWAEVASLMPDYQPVHNYLSDMNPDKVPLI